jgi:hypothetical protein
MRILQSPSILLRLEGAALLIGSISAYIYLQASGGLFALLILAPDLSMLGYLAGVKIGSTTYNLMRLAHIGGDRVLGFGLKYPTEFKDTHLQRV